MMPAAMIAWTSTKKWPAVVGASLAMPVLAIVQGSISILTFRLSFGDAPLPIVPSHGVVVVDPRKPVDTDARTTGEAKDDDDHDLNASQRSFPPSKDPRFLIGHAAVTESMHRTVLGRGELLTGAVHKRPLTLLVVGDSVGIGVGQSEVATPIMPEVIAKTLSKKMGGRMVYWTCHGGTGASSAWLVRELERGVGKELEEEEEDNELESLNFDAKSSGGDTMSESDESSTGSLRSGVVQGDETVEPESISDPLSKEAWQERLRHHRRRFHPEFMGPYDIAVVLTGPNDLKAAVFPFLLTGEDGELRKQAQERGGGQTGEMGRVLETLRSRMASSFRNARDSFQAAKDSVRERVEETVERVAPGSTWSITRKRRDSNGPPPNSMSVDMGLLKDNKASSSPRNHHKGHLPLIFLPGLPARANPMTQHLPLRWLLVPLFEILDYQKQILARESDGDVIFVPAPTTEEFVQFMKKKGKIYRDKSEEEVLVNLRDARLSTVRRTQLLMKEYYARKGRSAATNNPFKRVQAQLGLPPSIHLQGFSADGVHPNDLGYDYWGRHIAIAIYDEWQRRQPEW